MTKERVIFHLTRIFKALKPKKVNMEEMANKAMSFAERRRLLAQAESQAASPEYNALHQAIAILTELPEDKFVTEETPIKFDSGARSTVQADEG